MDKNKLIGKTERVYDTRGRLTKETQVITGSGTFLTQWGYNSAGQPSWMKYPADNAGGVGEQVNYTYHPQVAEPKFLKIYRK